MPLVKIGKYKIEITHPEKIYFPDSGITKGEFVEYYKKIAPVMLPHIKDKPVSMLRFPNGIKKGSFFQKDASDYYPDWIKTERVKKEGGFVDHVICNNAATLVYIANQGSITPHVWLSKIDKLDFPDRLIFDIDPSSENDIASIKWAVFTLKDFLSELGFTPFLMSTGSKGFHLTIPLTRKENFDEVRAFAQNCAKVLAENYSENLTNEIRKNKRKGRIFIDTARNAYAQTAVPPYSVRPLKGAPVAVPLYWEELSNENLHPQSYNIRNVFDRLENKCPWKNINQFKKSIKNAVKLLSKL